MPCQGMASWHVMILNFRIDATESESYLPIWDRKRLPQERDPDLFLLVFSERDQVSTGPRQGSCA